MKKTLSELMALFAMVVLLGFFEGAVFAKNITLINPSFESGTAGWSNATTDNSYYYAAPEGNRYATRSGSSGYTSQLTGQIIGPSEIYTLTIWARSINTGGVSNPTNVEVRLHYGSTTIASETQNVNPVTLQGSPQTYPNDDGGNVWLDQGYRMEFGAQYPFYQLESADPIYDTWYHQVDSDYDVDMAVGQIITPQGLKALYSTYYEESPFYSEIWISKASGNPPDYNWNPDDAILSHDGDENPWVIDAHLFYDEDTGRLWMTWGGHVCYISELNPTTGVLINNPADIEFDTHPAGTHIPIMSFASEVATHPNVPPGWSGDAWSSGYMEGPALYKYDGYYYAFGSYGNLGANYTIRMGRSDSPTGPFYDKDGYECTTFYTAINRYGCSMLLGDDGEHCVPGHPHIWQEDEKFYLGYDYRTDPGEEWDILGIRRLYWLNDWPTIWTPITVTFNADDHPDAIGQPLSISFRNTSSGSTAAFDYASLIFSLIGDMDSDIDVDFVDYAHFALEWLETGCGDCNDADFTGDGNVDANDLDIFTNAWLFGKE